MYLIYRYEFDKTGEPRMVTIDLRRQQLRAVKISKGPGFRRGKHPGHCSVALAGAEDSLACPAPEFHDANDDDRHHYYDGQLFPPNPRQHSTPL
jgi:hypothetical protein